MTDSSGPAARVPTSHQMTAMIQLTEVYPGQVQHHLSDEGPYVHAGYDGGATKMIEIRHPTRAAEALYAAIEALTGDPSDTDPRTQLRNLRQRLMALASSWEPGETPVNKYFPLNPAACAVELRQALGEPL